MNRTLKGLVLTALGLSLLMGGECTAAEDDETIVSGTLGAGGLRMKKWDELSREIVPRIIEKNLDMVSIIQYASRVECNVEASMMAPVKGATGRLSFSWYDKNGDGALSSREIKVREELGEMGEFEISISALKRDLETDLFFGVFGFFGDREVRSKKTDDGYKIRVDIATSIMDVPGSPSMVEFKVTKDLRISKVRYRLSEEQEWNTRELKHRTLDDRWLLSAVRETTPTPGGNTLVKERHYKYELRGGLPVLKSLVQKATFPTPVNTTTNVVSLEFKDWKLKKRQEPLKATGSTQEQEDDPQDTVLDDDAWEAEDDPWEEPGDDDDDDGGLWGDDWDGEGW